RMPLLKLTELAAVLDVPLLEAVELRLVNDRYAARDRSRHCWPIARARLGRRGRSRRLLRTDAGGCSLIRREADWSKFVNRSLRDRALLNPIRVVRASARAAVDLFTSDPEPEE